MQQKVWATETLTSGWLRYSFLYHGLWVLAAGFWFYGFLILLEIRIMRFEFCIFLITRKMVGVCLFIFSDFSFKFRLFLVRICFIFNSLNFLVFPPPFYFRVMLNLCCRYLFLFYFSYCFSLCLEWCFTSFVSGSGLVTAVLPPVISPHIICFWVFSCPLYCRPSWPCVSLACFPKDSWRSDTQLLPCRCLDFCIIVS